MVVPIPTEVDAKETGFTTNFLKFSLYLKSKVCVLFDFISRLNSSLRDKPCCCPIVVAAATVTSPFTFVKLPEIFSLII